MNILTLGVLLVSLSLGALAWILISVRGATGTGIQENLTRGFEAAATQERRTNFALEKLGITIAPDQYVQWIDRKLALAGRPAAFPLRRLLGAKLVLGGLGVGVGVLLVSTSSQPMKLIGIAVVALGYFIPDLLLISKGQERQKAMQLELANTLDQMLISVEAGLGFEGAMAKAGQNGRGPLAQEIVRTLQDMQVGRSRRESYLALAARTNVPELRSFVQAVVQADAYGIAISRVLRTQAKVMRVKRRQRAEEKAMKLPVAILFPLLFFIFPVLFIAILAPAALNAMSTFG
ncbi:type II secretion system F family protein [Arthrobacter roseus]|uniref:type II secretion system F family protein n=1 Tax=Arthrobacter roseus TaxID=136274 RepID=UPI0019624596|nr:type II secretion system F family protein [Arthrobacter roseus]MBM7849298.1 tight adherence protein C [Arthrobacter roseus]